MNFSGDLISQPKGQWESDSPHEFLIDNDLRVQLKEPRRLGEPIELIATRREGKQVAHWQLEANDELNAPLAITYKRDRIAVSTSNGRVHIVDSKSLQEVLPAIETSNSVEYAEFSPDGKWIITVEGNIRHRRAAKVWDVASGRLVFKIEAFATRVTAATFSKDGAAIVYLCGDADVRRI